MEDAHLLLSSRVDPPLAFSRWRARGQMGEIRDPELRLSEVETAGFLGEVMGLHLRKEEVRRLTERTEGWIAGVQLAALSLRGHADPSAFVKAFSGSQRLILDYLQEEILARQQPAIRRFLLRVCILPRMNAELCQAVTEKAGSLRALVSQQRPLLRGTAARTRYAVAVCDPGGGSPASGAATPRARKGRGSAAGTGPVERAGSSPGTHACRAGNADPGGSGSLCGSRALTGPIYPSTGIETGQPENYQRLFLDEDQPMQALLKSTLKEIQEPELVPYMRRLLEAFEQEAATSSSVPNSSALLEPLTPQENRVLRLLAEGASNQQIAAQMVVELSTVKKHMTNLLSKLGATNRTQAVVHAREYNLLQQASPLSFPLASKHTTNGLL